ncbi:MAG: ParM/StbA family protein, partial [Defluviitaleaceae bacterium]|nr:ParM/StbA family protein [Defluviitaleaceae bacterium]
ISIDHGNRLIKTEHMVFPAAFVESGHLPAIGSDVLKYQGKVYTLNDKNFPVQMDKTGNENYFILTLFALGKELVDEAKIIRKLTPHDPIRVELLIGMPIQDYEASRKKYEQYFGNRQGLIPFELNGQAYSVRLTGAHAFPQAYAVAVTGFGQLRDTRILNIVDIGGFTVDCLQMDKFMPNLSLCTSFYSGVNNLFQLINEQSRSTGGRDISSSILEGIIGKDLGVLTDYSEQRIKTVTSAAIAHTENMLAEIAQRVLSAATVPRVIITKIFMSSSAVTGAKISPKPPA